MLGTILRKLLGGRQKPSPSVIQKDVDLFWLTSRDKLKAICQSVGSASQQNQPVLLVACFGETFEQLSGLLTGTRLPVHVCEGPVSPAQFSRMALPGGTVFLALAHQLEPAPPNPALPGEARPKLLVRQVERHPLFEVEERVVRFLGALTLDVSFQVHASLDEEMLQQCGVDKLNSMLDQLVKEGEPLSHPFLERSFKSAQDRVAGLVQNEQRCHSAKEWFAVNLPGGLRR